MVKKLTNYSKRWKNSKIALFKTTSMDCFKLPIDLIQFKLYCGEGWIN